MENPYSVLDQDDFEEGKESVVEVNIFIFLLAKDLIFDIFF